MLLSRMREYSLRLVAEDAPIVMTIRFAADCLTRSDAFLSKGLAYLASFPTLNPGSELIS